MNIDQTKIKLCKMLFEQAKELIAVPSNDETERKAITEKINATVTVFDALNRFQY
ncbi:hypothetical protein AGMMS49975_25930 [Clostridia bacterium]|nr:hypothetical protein AGMMS49975_25930 [Clostridia bacterium]